MLLLQGLFRQQVGQMGTNAGMPGPPRVAHVRTAHLSSPLSLLLLFNNHWSSNTYEVAVSTARSVKMPPERRGSRLGGTCDSEAATQAGARREPAARTAGRQRISQRPLPPPLPTVTVTPRPGSRDLPRASDPGRKSGCSRCPSPLLPGPTFIPACAHLVSTSRPRKGEVQRLGCGPCVLEPTRRPHTDSGGTPDGGGSSPWGPLAAGVPARGAFPERPR